MKSAIWAVGFVLLLSATLRAEVYCSVPLAQLEIADGGALPSYGGAWQLHQRLRRLPAYVRMDGGVEAYLDLRPRQRQWPGYPSDYADGWGQTRLAFSAHDAGPVTGRLYVAKPDATGMLRLPFRIDPAKLAGVPDPKEDFFRAKRDYYYWLESLGAPGGAWFRHQAMLARAALGRPKEQLPARPDRWSTGKLEDTYAVFTGGRAMSENLQLDELLRPAEGNVTSVDAASLPGITVREIDWQPLIEGLKPQKDPLAELLPADQHALFFPDIKAAMTMLEEAGAHGTPVLQLLELRSEDSRTLERYERQLCFSLKELVRAFGPQLVAGVALTGSDPYMRAGTDVALLIEARNPEAVERLIAGWIRAVSALSPSVQSLKGEVAGIGYVAARSPDRAVCAYVARIGNAVVLTNSPAQLERLAAVQKGKVPSLASLPEYAFFRDRYPRGDRAETAFLILTDATIRRWCSARWRIGASRRVRAAAFMLDLHAKYMDALAKGEAKPGPIEEKMPLADGGELVLTKDGVASSVYGTVQFLTPIVELSLDKVTAQEERAYREWLPWYERRWRRYFDPIAVRFSLTPEGIATDVTVMPLMQWTRYEEFRAVMGGSKIRPDGGDPHDEAMVHLVMAVDPDSEPLRELAGLAGNFLGERGPGALDWLGQWVAIYAEDSPFWKEMEAARKSQRQRRYLEENFIRMPVAVAVDVRSGLKLTAFLAGVRAFVEQGGPGMTAWTALAHQEQPYVKITPTEVGKGRQEELTGFALCYAPSGDSLIISSNEDMLKQALERRVARKKVKEGEGQIPQATRPWLGDHVCLKVSGRFLSHLASILGERYQEAMQRRSWANLHILNEWKLRYPGRDPLALHEKVWGGRLVCPGGGKYVWDEQLETMASTAYGCPAAPKEGPAWPAPLARLKFANFGLTFEHDGLRARAVLDREAD